MRKVWGKVIGGTLGLMAGGPLGAAVGFIVGHVHDLGREIASGDNPWNNLTNFHGVFAGNAKQAAFTMGVIVLGAKMAKADGRVTHAEIEAFKRVFQVSPSQEAQVGRLFDHARQSAHGFEPYAFQLAQVFPKPVLGEILGGLFVIAAADSGGVSPSEIKFLKSVASIFNFDTIEFARVASRAGVRLPAEETPRSESNEAFAILGVREEATVEEIKVAYRALIREHHPDKLVAQGMPPEFIATATEKMKRINAAYDTVSKIKGIK
ncbi:MAG TPA: TerB family tellurite resistance protein [Alphaproteobacteria bacterium]|nr:TerB family tellurite resistance protein [Alphaproteobacteria bacterium]